jgi:photosystem II stability/assembly factor-like uncharacterized protein
MMLRIQTVILVAVLALCLPHTLHAQWLPTNGPLGGPARVLVGNDTFLFAEMHSSVFRSGDSGATWKRLNIGIPWANVNALAASGADIYAGTWGNGVWRSTDNGEHWISDTSVLQKQAIYFILPYGSDIIAGTTSNGVYRSTNHGTSWREMSSGLPSDYGISSAAVVDGYLIGCGNNARLYRYTDSSGMWTQISPMIFGGRMSASVAASGSDILVGWEHGVIRSTDNGTSWHELNAGLATTGSHPLAAGGRLFNATIYDGRFHVLDTGTMTWHPSGTGMNNGRVAAMTALGTILFAGTGDGIYRSTDNGEHWRLVNEGMVGTQITALAASGGTVAAGTHGGGVHLSSDNGAHWSSVGTGLPHRSPVTAFLLSDTAILAGTMYDGIYRSTDRGRSWHGVSNGLTDSTITGLGANDAYLFAATRERGGGIVRSDDNGASWTRVDMGLASPRITALAVNGSTLIAGIEDEGVYRSTDNGDNWEKVRADPSIVYVYAIAINGNTAVLADRNGIYYSSNNGAEWIRTEQNVRAYKLVVATADSSSLYGAGMSDRILRSSDGGRTWRSITAPPNAGYIAASTTSLFVGTSGYGVVRQPLSEISFDPPRRLLEAPVTGSPCLVMKGGKVTYRLNRRGVVSITIYDDLGHVVAQPLPAVMQNGGQHTVALGAEEFAVGSYRCSIVMGGREETVGFVVR